MCPPSRPSPSKPSVLPASRMPTGTPFWNFPARMFASPTAIAARRRDQQPERQFRRRGLGIAAALGVAHHHAARGAGRRIQRRIARAGHAQHAQLRQPVDQRCPAAACAPASTARCRNRPASPPRRPRWRTPGRRTPPPRAPSAATSRRWSRATPCQSSSTATLVMFRSLESAATCNSSRRGARPAVQRS